ncbi:hypothetical protein N8I74_09575 [Chitiniphilus purpureus]|uniref:DUF3253 domain-containing protein n=1 Tax=Chitiniphilus purpureus TaxID=2981137 RepID=A0ABY6DS94_9NEIS|nr:hypothetical protein [Chitiniphilus sp. CD1]UXY17236.1 hypothetical protein N8I74_09575 [Chitiniphilus sp. CD1]
MDEQLVDTVMQAIRAYVRARPDCADTIEGIHAWWVPWPDQPEPLSVTRLALERLEAEGVLERRHVGRRELWRARRE